MEIILNEEMLKELPFHDAELYSFSVMQNEKGQTQICLKIEINDEPCDEKKVSYKYEIPKKDGITTIFFKNSWFLGSDFICNLSNRDSIDDFSICSDSEKVSSLGIKAGVTHYFLIFNSGSRIDIIAEQLKLK